MSTHVTLYTTRECQYCQQVRQYLQQRQQPFFEIPTDDNPAAIHAVQKLTGQLIVPVTVVAKTGRTEMIITGFNQPRLDSALDK